MKENSVAKNEKLMKEWNWEKNNALNIFPDQLTCGSSKGVWWRCERGHCWKTAVSNRNRGHGCPYCSGRFAIKGVNDLQTQNPILASEWNYEKNGDLTPEKVTYSSNKKVWWKCKNGHEWIASISNRHKKRGCPFCSKYRHVSLPEKTIYYYLSKVFDIEENKKIDNQYELDLYIPSLNLGIEYDGRVWHKDVNRDIRKDNLCQNRGIKLIRVREFGLVEYDTSAFVIKSTTFDSELNFMNLIMRELISCINTIYNLDIRLDIDIDRDYYAILSQIEMYEDENSLAKQYPEVAKEWNYDKNGRLTPEMVSKGSGKRVWWICEKGHEWKTAINNRTNELNKNQCPYCQKKKTIIGENDIVSLKCDFLKDWDYNKNDVSPKMLMKNSGISVWWKCYKCGFVWKATVDTRSKHGCRVCSRKEAGMRRSKSVKNVDTGEIFNSAIEAGDKYCIKPNNINRVCSGERKTTGGFHWEYVDNKKD